MISSVCLGIGSDDITGEVNREQCEEELEDMASAYEKAVKADECFVHIRAKRSSNRDLRTLSRMTGSRQFKKV